MSKKNVLLPVQILNAADMSAATITSAATNVQYLDNVCYQLSWTGSPNGTFSMQGSLDYSPGGAGNLAPAAGSWTQFTSSTTASSPVLFDLNQLSFPWVRVVYTKTSGTGELTCYVSGKAV